jgi:hypothetical protein
MEATTGDDFPAQGNSDERIPLALQLPQHISVGISDFTRTTIYR